KAGAKLVELSVIADFSANTLTVIIADDGCGMTEEQVKAVIDPFYTTRTTRKVGLGVPFFKLAAESSGGTFDIRSKKGEGTVVTAVFMLDSIDRMPLGDMVSTVHTLVTMHENMDFVYLYRVDESEFTLDTREFRDILGDVSFTEPDVSNYIRDYLRENTQEVTGSKIF
ncbi:MAG: sensor histidine kinase, partial [Lachnospiraceae bacterium]|nr:sensor histidine kinase [Lachnospiraceae bacterium]